MFPVPHDERGAPELLIVAVQAWVWVEEVLELLEDDAGADEKVP